MRNVDRIVKAWTDDIVQFERVGIHNGKKLRHRFVVVDDAETLGKLAAAVIAQHIQKNPGCVLALPTGKTPLGLYRSLIQMYRDKAIDFSAVTTFNLDEFYGITKDNPASFASYMHRNFFSHINLHPANINLLDPTARDVDAECRSYEQRISDAGGIDVAILGIGQNGHIGFNEPGSAFDSRTRLVRLTAQTMLDNRSSFGRSSLVPDYALTMGIGTIMEAREIVLLASGKKKAGIVARALEGEVTIHIPASALQRHSRVTVILDRLAAAGLPGLSAV